MKKIIAAFLAAIVLMAGSAFLVRSQISSLSGLAVAQTLTPVQWNNVRDAIAASSLAGGVLATGVFAFDGLTMSRMTGTVANGLDVDVTRIAGGITLASDTANPTNALETGAFLMVFNGIDSNWDRNLTGTTGDGAGGAGMLANTPRVFGGTFWDRTRAANSLVDGGVGLGVTTVAPFIFSESGADYNRLRDMEGLATFGDDGIGVVAAGILGTNTNSVGSVSQSKVGASGGSLHTLPVQNSNAGNSRSVSAVASSVRRLVIAP